MDNSVKVATFSAVAMFDLKQGLQHICKLGWLILSKEIDFRFITERGEVKYLELFIPNPKKDDFVKQEKGLNLIPVDFFTNNDGKLNKKRIDILWNINKGLIVKYKQQ